MTEHTLFYIVLACQALLVSAYLPSQIVGRTRHLMETYPRADYPRLYPRTTEAYKGALQTYKRLNILALLVGLGLVFVGLAWPQEEMLGWDTTSVLALYMALQFAPLLVVATSGGFVFFNSRRTPDERSTRRADLRRRRVLDFVSPWAIGLAIAVYLGFVAFVIYVERFDYSWFGGYWNIVGVTGLNLVFAVVVRRQLVGKRPDPYQAEADRLRETEFTLKTMLFVSIAGTLFIALSIGMHALERGSWTPLATSLYVQLVGYASYRAFRIEGVDFEVYREEQATNH